MIYFRQDVIEISELSSQTASQEFSIYLDRVAMTPAEPKYRKNLIEKIQALLDKGLQYARLFNFAYRERKSSTGQFDEDTAIRLESLASGLDEVFACLSNTPNDLNLFSHLLRFVGVDTAAVHVQRILGTRPDQYFMLPALLARTHSIALDLYRDPKTTTEKLTALTPETRIALATTFMEMNPTELETLTKRYSEAFQAIRGAFSESARITSPDAYPSHSTAPL